MKTESYTIENVEKACRSLKADERELWTLTVRLEDLPRQFKYGPNARHASVKAPPVKEMLTTLENEPESFVFYNNGMMVVAQSIKVDGKRVLIECQEPQGEEDEDEAGHGVLNGGHTYLALLEAMKRAEAGDKRFAGVGERARVVVTVGIGIPDEEIWQISRARNTSQKVPLYALRELAGDWSLLKDNVPPATRPLVAYKPNDPDALDAEYDITDLVRRIALLNNDLFPAQDDQHPKAAYTSLGSLVRKYRPEQFQRIAHLLPDALRLEEMIVAEYTRRNTKGKADSIAISRASGCKSVPKKLLSGATADITIADAFTLPVLAAFRLLVKRDGTWFKPLDEIWKDFGPDAVDRTWAAYKDQGKSSAAVFGRSNASWQAACRKTVNVAIHERLVEI
jgi:hypothetical protein